MTTEEKFSEVENNVFGSFCPVTGCPYNINGHATCSEWKEDHCVERLFFEQPVSDTDDPFIPLEPWVSEKDIIHFNYGLIKGTR